MAKSTRRKQETPEMKRAYDHYLALGPTRTCQKAADYMRLPLPSVYRWRRVYEWDKRILAIREGIEAKAREQLIKEQVSDDEEYIETIGKAIKIWVENRLGSGNSMDTILALSMADIRELMKTYNSLKKELKERNSDGAPERLAAKIYNELTIEQLKEIKIAAGHLPPSSSTPGPGDLRGDSEQDAVSHPSQDLGGLSDEPES